MFQNPNIDASAGYGSWSQFQSSALEAALAELEPQQSRDVRPDMPPPLFSAILQKFFKIQVDCFKRDREFRLRQLQLQQQASEILTPAVVPTAAAVVIVAPTTACVVGTAPILNTATSLAHLAEALAASSQATAATTTTNIITNGVTNNTSNVVIQPQPSGVTLKI